MYPVEGVRDSDSVFVLEYNEVGNINTYRFNLTVIGNGVDVEFSERAGALPGARFHG